MAEPLGDSDKHGLSTTARAWTPKGMVRTPEGRRLMEGLADALGLSMNLLVEFEKYAPIILNPSRNLDGDLFRVLDLNGIETRDLSMSNEKLRRLAILAPQLRFLRGAFQAHRIIASALTGGPVVVRSWIVQRYILDASDLGTLTLLSADSSDDTDIFVFGQGPSATQYNAVELSEAIDDLAKPILDDVNIIPCWALTAWRNGIGSWSFSGDQTLVRSDLENEYQGIDMGPAVDSTTLQAVQSPTESDPAAVGEGHHVTAFFKTDGTLSGDYWEIYAFASKAAPGSGGSTEAYIARINVRNGTTTVHKKYAGVVGPALGSHPFNISDGLGTISDYHRADFIVHHRSSEAIMRVIVDGNPSPWFSDPTIFSGSRPKGVLTFTSLTTTSFTQGRLRILAITARTSS